MKYFYTVVFFLFTTFVSQAQIQGYSLNDVVDDFTVTDIHGDEHNLYTYTSEGKYVFIDFSFTSCGPCQTTAPIFNEFYDKYGCNNGEVVCMSMFGTLSTDHDPEVEAFENTYGGTFNHAPAISVDGGATPVDSNFNPAAYPTVCLIDPDNKIIKLDIWPINGIGDLEATFSSEFNPTPMNCTESLFTVATHDGTPITDGSVFTFSEIGEEADLTFDITNIGADVLDMRLEYVSNTNTTIDGEVLCIFQQCLPPGAPAPGEIYPLAPQAGGPQEIDPGVTTNDGDHFYSTDPGDDVNYPIEYTFRFFDVDGLATPITFTYSYDGTASVEDLAEVNYKLFPTITSDFLTLEITEPVSARLINSQGQLIKQFNFEAGSHTIDVSSFAKQLYYLKLRNAQGQQSLAKILVK